MKSTLLSLLMVGVASTAMAQNFSDYFTVKLVVDEENNITRELTNGESFTCTAYEEIPGIPGVNYEPKIQVISKENDSRAIFGQLGYTGKPSKAEQQADPTKWGGPSLCYEGADAYDGYPSGSCLPEKTTDAGSGFVWVPAAGTDTFKWDVHVFYVDVNTVSTYRLTMVAMNGEPGSDLEETDAVFTVDITFAKDASGVDPIEDETAASGVYYDLQGRRVENPVKGLYIVDGKKVVVK